MIGLGLLLIADPTSAVAAELLRVEHAVITRQAQADNGTGHLYVRNMTDRPVAVDKLALASASSEPEDLLADSDRNTEDSEPGPPWLWWRSLPDPVPPHGFADLAVKLARPPIRKLSLRFTGPGGLDLQRQLDHCNDALNINFVGFSATFDVLYAYVENRLDTPVRPRTVQVNGMDVTASARFLGGEMAPGSKAAVVVRLARPFSPGEIVFLRIAGEPSRQGVALVRAFSEFPISWIDGSMPEGLGVRNEEVHLRPGHVSGEAMATFENIMRCPAHAHGTRREAAAQFIGLYQSLMRTDPHVPGMIYVCRWEKERNYFVFAELGDAVRVMPFAGSASYVSDPLDHRSQWLTALAVRAAAPRPVHAVVPIRFEDSYEWKRSCTPDEIRALIYLPLSRGAKGLCYGKRLGGLSEEATRELAEVTRQVASIRDYLVFSEPMNWARTSRSTVEAAALLAGDRALVLLLINHSFGDFDNDHVLRSEPQRNVQVEITLPMELSVSTVTDVENQGRPVAWRVQDGRLVVNVDEVKLVRPFLVTFDRPGGRQCEGSLAGSSQP